MQITRRQVLRTGTGVAVVGAFAAAAAAGPPGYATESSGRVTALNRVTVVDPVDGRARPERTILLADGRIVDVGPSERIRVPDDALVIDLAGKYVIPGLIDMHVHSIESEAITPPVYLAHGITTVREMWGTEVLRSWRDRVEGGDLFGPRQVVASPIIDGPNSGGDPAMFIVVGTPDEARQAVRDSAEQGADFIKVYSGLTDPLHRAVADEADRCGLGFAGHCPDLVPLSTAAERGQRSVEHLYGCYFDISSREDEIRRSIAELDLEPGDIVGYNNAIHELEWTAVNSYRADKARRVLAGLRRRSTAVVPTLVVHTVMDRPDEVDLDDERMKYIPASRLEFWPWAMENIIKAGRDPEVVEQRYEMLENRRRLVGAIHAAGVQVLAGTDAGDLPYLYPGAGLHDELAELVESGLTPSQALAAATIEPARYLGLDSELGGVQAGKLADLVVLDADPLADIRNTTRIDAVVAGGRVITSDDRGRMLAAAAEAAAQA